MTLSPCSCPDPIRNPSWRNILQSAVAGSMLSPAIVQQVLANSGDPPAPREPHFPAKAKRVIFLFMTGGVSHVDSFDDKPTLTRDHRMELTLEHPEIKNRPGYERIFRKRPQWDCTPYGESGTRVSSRFPHITQCVDDMAIIRPMHTSHSNHYKATLGMHTGSFTVSRPDISAWLSYDLGTVNRNIPGVVVIAPRQTDAGTQVYVSDFLPGENQGTLVVPGAEPVANIAPRTPLKRQLLELSALRAFHQRRQVNRPYDPQFAARMQSFETAFDMQMAVPDAFNFGEETSSTLGSYGPQPGQTSGFGRQCLAARHLIERGVRFVELIDGGSSGNWGAHDGMMSHVPLAKNVDLPIAALLKDLKQRGLLEDTLVAWTTETGRTPVNNSADAKGREHHPWAFSSWLAGAGVKAGIAYAATDEHGLRSVEQTVHVHDFDAIILAFDGLSSRPVNRLPRRTGRSPDRPRRKTGPRRACLTSLDLATNMIERAFCERSMSSTYHSRHRTLTRCNEQLC